MKARGAVVMLVVLVATAASAHKPSDGYLLLRAEGATVTVRLDLAARDLDAALGLDVDGDGQVTWGEVMAQRPRLEAEVLPRLGLAQAGAACPLASRGLRAVAHSDGEYVVFDLVARCPQPVGALTVRYEQLFDVDALHRGLLRLEGGGDGVTVFSSAQRQRDVAWQPTAWTAQFSEAFREGAHHLAIGFDHLAFLFALLLPSVLRRRGGAWEPVPALRPALLEIAGVVTSFTVAHSITLALSAFELVTPDLRWVEVAIAASVGLAALNNLVPVLPEGRWPLAFALGLLHGFGFSAALADLGATRLGLTVFGFNLGVEVGQLAIVAVVMPVAFALRAMRAYGLIFRGGSAVILGAALFWVVERL